MMVFPYFGIGFNCDMVSGRSSCGQIDFCRFQNDKKPVPMRTHRYGLKIWFFVSFKPPEIICNPETLGISE